MVRAIASARAPAGLTPDTAIRPPALHGEPTYEIRDLRSVKDVPDRNCSASTSPTDLEKHPVNVLLLGATGMVGHGILHACITDVSVSSVTVVTRRTPALTHPKVRVLTHQDFTDLTPLRSELAAIDACHYAIGTSSTGVTEADYTRVTRDYALSAARTLVELGNRPAFIYVSGRSADSSENGPVMWARVKGSAENALRALPLRTHILRPGYIRPLHGARPSSSAARAFYTATGPLYPVLRRMFPDWTTSTEAVGRAAIALSRPGIPYPSTLTSRDINRLAGM